MFDFKMFRRTPKGGTPSIETPEPVAALAPKPSNVVAPPTYGYIYRIVCRTNNKGYIGQTTQEPKERWHQHRQDARRKKQANGITKRFHFALHEHGESSFEFAVIDTATSHDELNQKERHWIAHYKYGNPEYGYNSTSGGAGQKEQSGSSSESARAAYREAKKKQSLEEKKVLEELAAKRRIEWEEQLREDWERGGNVYKAVPPLPTDIEGVGSMLVQELPPEDYEGSELRWERSGRGRGSYRLSLDFSNGSVHIFNNYVECLPPDDKWGTYKVTGTIREQQFEGLYPSFALALKAADTLVETKAPEDYKRLRRDYEPPADEQQRKYLKTLYGDRQLPANLTYKQAQQLIKEHRWTSPNSDKQQQKRDDDAIVARIVQCQ